MPEVFRIDSVPISQLTVRADGAYTGDVVLTRAGIFTYRGPNGQTIRELRSPEEVFNADSVASANLIPITVDHPSDKVLNAENSQAFSVGFTGETARRDGMLLRNTVCVNSAGGIQAARNGKRQGSCGYNCTVTYEPGVWQGERYDSYQSNIRYNHFALVEQGRAGKATSFRLDADDAIMVDDAGQPTPPAPNSGRSSTMPEATLKLDSGVPYQVPAEVEAAYRALQGKATETQTKLDAVTTERDTLKADVDKITAQRDEAKAALEKVQKTDHSAAIADGVKARLGLVDAARRAKLGDELTQKLDSMSDQDIRVAVIQSRHKDWSAEGKSAEYVQARFDAVVEGLDSEPDQGASIAGTPGQTRRNDRCDPEAAREKAIAEEKRRSRGEK